MKIQSEARKERTWKASWRRWHPTVTWKKSKNQPGAEWTKDGQTDERVEVEGRDCRTNSMSDHMLLRRVLKMYESHLPASSSEWQVIT